MDPELHSQTQRRRSNLFAFRRLKWGRPPARFRLETVIKGEAARRSEALPDYAIGHHAPPQIPKVANLSGKRGRERMIDLAVIIAAVGASLALGLTLLG